MIQDNVESRATHATHATLMDLLKSRRRVSSPPEPELPPPAAEDAPTKVPESVLASEDLSQVPVEAAPSMHSNDLEPGMRACLGCGKAFIPSSPARTYCCAKCWNTRRPEQ